MVPAGARSLEGRQNRHGNARPGGARQTGSSSLRALDGRTMKRTPQLRSKIQAKRPMNACDDPPRLLEEDDRECREKRESSKTGDSYKFLRRALFRGLPATSGRAINHRQTQSSRSSRFSCVAFLVDSEAFIEYTSQSHDTLWTRSVRSKSR